MSTIHKASSINILRASGFLNLVKAHEIYQEVIDSIEGHAEVILIDIRDVNFIDEMASKLLSSCRQIAEERGVHLFVIG